MKSNVKTTLIASYNSDGLVHLEIILRGQSMHAEFCKIFLQCLCNTVQTSHWEVAHQQLYFTPWKCLCLCVSQDKCIFWWSPHSNAPTPSILTWPCSLWLFPQWHSEVWNGIKYWRNCELKWLRKRRKTTYPWSWDSEIKCLALLDMGNKHEGTVCKLHALIISWHLKMTKSRLNWLLTRKT